MSSGYKKAVARLSDAIGYPESMAGPLLQELILLANPDPHRVHWDKVAKAAEAMTASVNCSAQEARALCQSLDRLTDAILGHIDPVDKVEDSTLSVGVRNPTDPFADIRDKRIGELTPEQADRATELWLRKQIGPSETYWHPHLQCLFRVIDRLRSSGGPARRPIDYRYWSTP